MQKHKALISAVLAVAALVVLSSAALTASATTVAPFTLSASSGLLQYTLPAGTTFNGSIQATGTVRVWVNAPNGVQIVNLGLVDGSATFGFVAPQDGNYLVNFENTLSNPVEVTFSYTTNPDLSGNTGNPLQILSSPLITVAIIVVGSALIIFVVRRKNRNKAVADEPSEDEAGTTSEKT